MSRGGLRTMSCAVMIAWSISGLSGLGATRNVVVLYDERTQLPGLTLIEAGITRALAQAPERVEIYREEMDNSRFDSPAYRNNLRDHLRAKYAGKQIDVAIAVMGPALDFLLNHRGTLFAQDPEVPIVFCGIDRKTFGDRLLPPGVTGVLVKREFVPTLKLALDLHRDTKRIVVVSGRSEFDASVLGQAREDFRAFEDRLTFTYRTNQSMRELLSELGRLPPDTLVMYTTMFRDGANDPHVPHEAAEQISRAASVPVYSFVDQYLGRGIVGGELYRLGAHGEAAGGLALKILTGTSASALPPIEPESGLPMFDGRQLKRWGISEANLPAGSTIQFREPSMWQRFKGRIIAAVIIVLVQAGIISILLANLIKRRRAERNLVASEERYRAVVESQTDLVCRFLPDGTLTFVNDEYCRFFGRSREELIGRSLLDLIPAKYLEYAKAKIAALAQEPYRTEAEHEVVTADGIVRWQEWTDIAVRDERGRVIEMQGVGHDITERKRAELALRESEARFRIVADAAPVMIWMTGPDKLCTFINKGWLEFTGRTLEQELGSGWVEGIHPDDSAACARTYEEAFEARREFTMEYRIRTWSSEYAWILDIGTPRFVAGVFAGYVGAATDISAVKQAQERWRSVVEAAPNAMLVVNADGKITLVNARTEEVFGYNRVELLGQPVELLVPEDGFRANYMANAKAEPMKVAGQRFGRRKNGHPVPLEISLNTIRAPEGQFVLASFIDVTERIEAEARLRESENRMTMAADAANLGMWVWDAPATTMWASAKWRSIFGYGQEEDVRYDALIERVHPDDRECVETEIANAFNERGAFEVQHRVLLPDGTTRWISSSGRMEQVENNGVLRMLGISIDITERKTIEEDARQVSGKLINAQEEERCRIARDLHDDLNQRLALLSVDADLLGRMNNESPAQNLISGIANRVRDLSTEIHRLSYELHPAKLDQLGLVSATRSFCQEISKQFGLPVDFVYDGIPRDLSRVLALPLYRIVQESLHNVVKHSRATTARVELRRKAESILLMVADDGCGFDMTARHHEPGIGLVGMRERVRLVHGQIAFQSAPGHGTRIEVKIPLTIGTMTVA